MYSVNFLIIEGYELKVAKGTPIIKKDVKHGSEWCNRSTECLTFYSPEFFELHVMKNGEVHGIITPGGGR